MRRVAEVTVRPASLADIEDMLEVESAAWPEESRASREMLESRISVFPEGQLCAFSNGHMVGHAATQIIRLDLSNPPSSWFSLTDNGFIRASHDPKGDTLYGINMSVGNSSEGSVAGALLQAIKNELIIDRKLLRGAMGSRMPGYHRYAAKMSAWEYATAKRSNGNPLDPEISLFIALWGGGGSPKRPTKLFPM